MRNLFWSPVVGFRGLALRNAADAGGPGGPVDNGGAPAGGEGLAPEADAGDSTPDANGEGQAPAAADGGDEDDLDEDDDPSERERLEQHNPRVAKKLGKLNRFNRVARPIVQAMRGLGIDPKDKAAVAAFFQRAVTPPTPAIAPAPTAPPAKAAEQEPKWEPLRHDLPFDDSPFKDWDLTVPGNKALVDRIKAGHTVEMRQNALTNGVMAMFDEVKELRAELKAIKDGTKAEKTEARVKTWRAAVVDAVSKIKDPEVADAFRDAVNGAAARERAMGRQPDLPAIVALQLKRFQKTGHVTAGEAARVAAGAQAIADRNRSAPTRASLVPGGTPASAAANRSNETLRSIHAGMFGNRRVSVTR